jgi:rare lipoprotein A
MTRLPGLAGALALLALAGCTREPLRPTPPAAPVTPPAAPVTPPAGEGAPGEEPRARSGNPPFYDVEGRRYVVMASAAGYIEEGVASWYGSDFHGGRTATGETYDMNALTGAHPTLPLPTWVRVTNLDNGKSVVVRLNDRGPFAKGRIIDLSRAAAEQLDMVQSGTARVEVRSLSGGPGVCGPGRPPPIMRRPAPLPAAPMPMRSPRACARPASRASPSARPRSTANRCFACARDRSPRSPSSTR